ncbi:N-terminal domain of NEFA-interacting nuclear protein NIP30-domain-containing protein [Gigaspora rosea]|uniref:N-terminal domain of NEFA-interacting nuclear protein NIP30-domain-containing protein n=1 Tax=Gigaspora rosea TaxID=44941 RepID=A0A397U6V2_9GLOM|nr:N-terminal domain of NEFA-interacting nuclear protein NIP30-domain-containing protein [Gigaspora rosea]
MDQKFVSSTEIEEARKKRAEEWKAAYERLGEKPPEIEEEYDPRTLYEKLQEQKMKKEEAFQEMTRFSNLIHRLDEDEIDFLATLEHEQRGKEMEKMKKVEEELEEFRRAAAKADEEAVPKLIIQPETISTAPIKPSVKKDAQRMILANAIKIPSRKRSLNNDDTNSSNSNEQSKDQKRSKLDSSSSNETATSSTSTTNNNVTNNTLASLLAYSDNSSSDESTSDDES